MSRCARGVRGGGGGHALGLRRQRCCRRNQDSGITGLLLYECNSRARSTTSSAAPSGFFEYLTHTHTHTPHTHTHTTHDDDRRVLPQRSFYLNLFIKLITNDHYSHYARSTHTKCVSNCINYTLHQSGPQQCIHNTYKVLKLNKN